MHEIGPKSHKCGQNLQEPQGFDYISETNVVFLKLTLRKHKVIFRTTQKAFGK